MTARLCRAEHPIILVTDLQKHLNNDTDAKAGTEKRDEAEDEKRAIELEKTLKPLEYGSATDFQLMQALNHLKGLPVQLAKPADKADSKEDGKDDANSDKKSEVPGAPSAPAAQDLKSNKPKK